MTIINFIRSILEQNEFISYELRFDEKENYLIVDSNYIDLSIEDIETILEENNYMDPERLHYVVYGNSIEISFNQRKIVNNGSKDYNYQHLGF
ncbi:hypothetical protein H8356DRAFT_1354403 [Neocallimastix lanati (nom. inval.)]|nr:hypothetical protein H8356DRAFT_1354403 [Neocallimastix sp. JGI-2020a]